MRQGRSTTPIPKASRSTASTAGSSAMPPQSSLDAPVTSNEHTSSLAKPTATCASTPSGPTSLDYVPQNPRSATSGDNLEHGSQPPPTHSRNTTSDRWKSAVETSSPTPDQPGGLSSASAPARPMSSASSPKGFRTATSQAGCTSQHEPPRNTSNPSSARRAPGPARSSSLAPAQNASPDHGTPGRVIGQSVLTAPPQVGRRSWSLTTR